VQAIPPPTGKVPVDWAQRVAAGFMLYNETEPTREALRPQVGNGYLATVIEGDSVYISGVFNPIVPNDPASLSRRSRFPTPVRLSVEGATPYASALDVRRGVFYRRSFISIHGMRKQDSRAEASCMALFEQRWYAHRLDRSLLIQELEIDASRCASSTELPAVASSAGGDAAGAARARRDFEPEAFVFNLSSDDGGNSKDINFTQVDTNTAATTPSSSIEGGRERGAPAPMEVSIGSTILPEKPGGILIGTAYATTPLPNSLSVVAGSKSTTFYFITAYATSLDFMPYPLSPRLASLAGSLGPQPPPRSLQLRQAGPDATCPRRTDDVLLDCGNTLSQADCLGSGCCYDASPQPNGPRCFFAANITQQAIARYQIAFRRKETLLKSHIQEWESLTQAGIDIEGDPMLRDVVYASYYAILSSIRSDWGFSVSPGGLSTGGGNATGYPRQEEEGYFGHTFWDADTWVMPSLLPLYPDLAQSIIEYRFNRLPASRLVAASYALKGTKFSWESALTGLEECVHPNLEDHLSADVAIAVRQFFWATNDLTWLRNVGFPILQGTSDFWVSRAVKDATGQYVINDIQPPNEYAEHVNNSVFTNAAASLALNFTVRAAHLLGLQVPDIYMEVSNKLKIPFDPAVNSTSNMTDGCPVT